MLQNNILIVFQIVIQNHLHKLDFNNFINKHYKYMQLNKNRSQKLILSIIYFDPHHKSLYHYIKYLNLNIIPFIFFKL